GSSGTESPQPGGPIGAGVAPSTHRGLEPPPTEELTTGENDGTRSDKPTSGAGNQSAGGAASGQSGKEACGTSRGTSARRQLQDEEPTGLQSIGFRRDVSNDPGDAGRLPVARPSEAAQPGESTLLTLAAARDVLTIMFDEIEKVVDGNSRQVVSHLNSVISPIVSTLTRDVATPLSNHILRLNDVLQNHIKSVGFSLSNLSSVCNSNATSIQSLCNRLIEIGQEVKSLNMSLGASQKQGMSTDLVGLENRLGAAIQENYDNMLGALEARPECDSAKLVQVVQDLDARVYRLDKSVSACVSTGDIKSTVDGLGARLGKIERLLEAKNLVENGKSVATAIEATMARVTGRLDQLLLMKGVTTHSLVDSQESITATVDAVVEVAVNKAMLKIEDSISSVLGQGGTELGLSQGMEDLHTQIVDCSEGQRRDFMKLNERLDNMLSQHCSEGSALRAGLAELAASVKSSIRDDGQLPLAGTGNKDRGVPRGEEAVSVEVQKQLTQAISKSDWPTFSGKGEYDHLDFINWIDSAKRHSNLNDGVIVLKLLTILTDGARSWFKTMEARHQNKNWDFWREELCKKYGTSSWKRKKEDAFDADKFVPGETAPSDWVTRQYDRLQCFSPGLSQESINFKLLRLMENEVEFAVKTAMRDPAADLSTLTNILEDICDKTRLGRKRFVPRQVIAEKVPAGLVSKPKPALPKQGTGGLIMCYTCNETGHTSRRCPKKVNNVLEDKAFDEDEEESCYDPEGPIIGDGSQGAFVVGVSAGKNNLWERAICGSSARLGRNISCLLNQVTSTREQMSLAPLRKKW
ncbi:uncharacterized protein VP01_30g1, partial [Puccinia sorghi]